MKAFRDFIKETQSVWLVYNGTRNGVKTATVHGSKASANKMIKTHKETGYSKPYTLSKKSIPDAYKNERIR